MKEFDKNNIELNKQDINSHKLCKQKSQKCDSIYKKTGTVKQ
jgi:hypothetical protein